MPSNRHRHNQVKYTVIIKRVHPIYKELDVKKILTDKNFQTRHIDCVGRGDRWSTYSGHRKFMYLAY